jgi:hypothetical protein
MHRNGTTVLHSQCGMNSEPIPGPETLPHTNILFRPSELTGYCLIFNIHSNIKSIVVICIGIEQKFSVCNVA